MVNTMEEYIKIPIKYDAEGYYDVSAMASYVINKLNKENKNARISNEAASFFFDPKMKEIFPYIGSVHPKDYIIAALMQTLGTPKDQEDFYSKRNLANKYLSNSINKGKYAAVIGGKGGIKRVQ